jgi:hypothetical protein
VETPKPTKEPSAQASQVETKTTKESPAQVAEKSTLYSIFPSLESIFGGKSNTNISTANSSVVEKNKPSQVTEEKPATNTTKPNNVTVEQKTANKPVITNPSSNPPVVTKSPDNTVKENPIKLPTRTPSVGNPYPRPNPTTPIPNPVPSPIPRNPMPERVVVPPVPAPITPAPTGAGVPSPAPVPAPLPPITLMPIPSVPAPVPTSVTSPAPMPMPSPAPNKTPTTMDENPNRRRRRLEMNPSDVTEIQKSAIGEPYIIKTAPTLVIYPFIGGDERRIKARTSERYSKEVRRVREVNYEEQRATMEADPPDQPILEYNVEGVPNRFRMPEPKTIPPAPALGKDG